MNKDHIERMAERHKTDLIKGYLAKPEMIRDAIGQLDDLDKVSEIYRMVVGADKIVVEYFEEFIRSNAPSDDVREYLADPASVQEALCNCSDDEAIQLVKASTIVEQVIVDYVQGMAESRTVDFVNDDLLGYQQEMEARSQYRNW